MKQDYVARIDQRHTCECRAEPREGSGIPPVKKALEQIERTACQIGQQAFETAELVSRRPLTASKRESGMTLSFGVTLSVTRDFVAFTTIFPQTNRLVCYTASQTLLG